jgi:hypothetical protein
MSECLYSALLIGHENRVFSTSHNIAICGLCDPTVLSRNMSSIAPLCPSMFIKRRFYHEAICINPEEDYKKISRNIFLKE